MGRRWNRKGRIGKLRLIKEHMPASVQAIGLNIKTQKSFRNIRVTQENAFSNPMFKFVFSVRPKVRVASTTKHLKGSNIWMKTIKLEPG